MNRNLFRVELAGGVFVAACSCLMRSLYAICDGELLGILFGAVNGSIWESCKTLLLPALLWGILEVMSLSLPLHRFTVAKTAAVWTGAALYLLLRTTGMRHLPAELLALGAVAAMTLLLFHLSFSIEWLFAPALVLLFLLLSLYFSLTPFPPHMPLFRDDATGVYGIIPKHYDCGAAALDAQYMRIICE